MTGEKQIPVESDSDIVLARQEGRTVAAGMGFSPADATLVATAISELARNIVLYARQGEIRLWLEQDHGRPGLVVEASDRGPGIADIDQVMQDGFSTSGNLGLGLPGVRRLMDETDVVSRVGVGTTVTAKKWTR